jgi:primosomal protein N' (replication factor Y) (superfamily II helicase)
MEKLERAPKQLDALLAVLQLTENGKIQIPCKLAQEKAGVELSVLNTLQTKGVLVIYEVEVSRLASFDDEGTGNFPLSEIQKAALDSINAQFEQKKVVLLHGVTGSGKTQVFVELMQENLDKGKQVLYLLPEIGLTAQIVGRLQKHFGDKIVVYHSKFNTHERVEIWKSVMNGVPIILGARSALFLPFQNLGLILVDEEHDPSYKQADPSPRYNARDTAAFMAHLYDCRTLLGTATPSLETYFNVQQKKYGLVEMMNRFGGLAMPEIHISDIRAATKSKQMKSMFAPDLLTAIQTCLTNGEQIILFQNRRGYAPMYKCFTCGWTTNCTRCDVSMTYHKHLNELHCHYCGNAHRPPRLCGACGSVHLGVQGFGTEKIEDEIQIYCPDAKTLRMDWDTVKGKTGADDIIQKFDKKQVNVLIGTQMVTKGLDFDNVGLVGVLSADQMLQFPDFRASERAYQLLTQVAGRAGRKKKQGKVIIQAFKTEHPVLGEIQQNDFKAFLERELQEREQFGYPPFARLIGIQLRHKKQPLLEQAANFFAEALRTQVTGAVLGPAVPNISFVREYFRMDILVKLPRNQELIQVAKKAIYQAYIDLKSMSGLSSVRVYIDVDPY